MCTKLPTHKNKWRKCKFYRASTSRGQFTHCLLLLPLRCVSVNLIQKWFYYIGCQYTFSGPLVKFLHSLKLGVVSLLKTITSSIDPKTRNFQDNYSLNRLLISALLISFIDLKIDFEDLLLRCLL